jgi:hypothetical protein
MYACGHAGHLDVTSLTRAKPLRLFARLTLLAPACGRTRPENQERMTHWAASARTIQTQRSALGWQEPHGLLSTSRASHGGQTRIQLCPAMRTAGVSTVSTAELPGAATE